MKLTRTGILFLPLLIIVACASHKSQAEPQFILTPPDSIRYIDPERQYFVIGEDTVRLRFQDTDSINYGPLTDKDFREVAEQLSVEPAAMKAVVEIEAGRSHQGFWDTNKPLINFDLSVYRKMAARHKINLSKYTKTHPAIFSRPNAAKYGSQQAAVQARLDQAMSIDSVSAIEGTFWGMFQIGGFNWRQCGTDSALDFYKLMSRSERDQLELFAEFITRAGLLPALKAKNWSAFARGYNGPSYAARGYHRRLAAAYQKYKNK